MRAIHATPHVAALEVRLEWMLERLLAESLRRTPSIGMPILVGGTALRRAYRLTRPSTDLDFAVETEREMTRVRNAVTRLARQRWPAARTRERNDGEEGWRIEDEQGRALLFIGGLTMGNASLDLACWVRETWTLPIGRLATMKIKAGTELRNKARDLYDMGFIAESYPGEITRRQAEMIREEGLEATRPSSKRADDHRHDNVLHTQSLTQMGQDVTVAANEALRHIQGAREGRWANQSTAAFGLADAVWRDPLGTWEIDDKNPATHESHILCAWRAPNGDTTWRAIMENEHRLRCMLLQASLEKHPAMRAAQRPHPRATSASKAHQAAQDAAARAGTSRERERRQAEAERRRPGRARDD